MREENDRKQRILTDKGGRMKIEIKRWDNREVIVSGEYGSFKEAVEQNKEKLSYADLRFANLSSADLRSANLSSANLSCADLSCADLRSANLSSANLSFANLSFANLSCADLSSANLRSANLSYANLSCAKYKEPIFLQDLYSLKLQPKTIKLRFWKYMENGRSPYQNAEYEVGKTYNCVDYDSDENNSCGEGLNVATLTWCLKDSSEADEFLEVEFFARDIIAIPFANDGKFRVKKLKVIKKYSRKQVLELLNKKKCKQKEDAD